MTREPPLCTLHRQQQPAMMLDYPQHTISCHPHIAPSPACSIIINSHGRMSLHEKMHLQACSKHAAKLLPLSAVQKTNKLWHGHATTLCKTCATIQIQFKILRLQQASPAKPETLTPSGKALQTKPELLTRVRIHAGHDVLCHKSTEHHTATLVASLQCFDNTAT